MRKLLPLLLCLSLSIFALARATKPAQVFAPKADANASVHDASTEEQDPSHDDDSTPGASNDDGEDANDDDGNGAGVGDGAGVHDGTAPDDGGNDDEDDDDDDSGDPGE